MDVHLHRPGLRITFRRLPAGLLYLREESPRPGSSAHVTALARRPHLLQQALTGRTVTLPPQETDRRLLRTADDLRRVRLPPLTREERHRLDQLSGDAFGPRT